MATRKWCVTRTWSELQKRAVEFTTFLKAAGTDTEALREIHRLSLYREYW